MFLTNPKICLLTKRHTKTDDRVTKIRELLSLTLRKVHQQLNYAETSPSLSKRKSQQSSECEQINEILTNLRHGYLVSKHSERIDQPHHKFIYLSEDSRSLCWKSLDKEDQKRVELNSITKVVKQGSQFYLKASRICDISCCIVIVTPSRNLQLEATNQMEAEYLKYELQRAIKYSKAMHLNYRYSQC